MGGAKEVGRKFVLGKFGDHSGQLKPGASCGICSGIAMALSRQGNMLSSRFAQESRGPFAASGSQRLEIHIRSECHVARVILARATSPLLCAEPTLRCTTPWPCAPHRHCMEDPGPFVGGNTIQSAPAAPSLG